jgi:hypothetical protein
MRHQTVRTSFRGTHVAAISLALLVASAPALAQNAPPPTPEAYVARAGGDARILPAGQLRLDGKPAICGQRPTVLDSGLSDFSASFPGYLVLNPRRLASLSLPVQMWIHAQSCGYQFRGPDGSKADCFAVERGREQGWLTDAGMDNVCAFIAPTSASAAHAAGPERCKVMRGCFAAASAKASAPNAPKPAQ